MKKKYPFHISMRVQLTVLLAVEIAFIVLAAWVITRVMEHFQVTLAVPDIVWLIGFSVLLGGAVNTFLSKWIFAPITRLGDAMGEVAKGDFDIRLEEEHQLREIETIYRNFNLMTKELGATEILQTDFVSNVSHEFKTPINAIEGYATLLQGEENVTAQERERYVEKILFNTRRLSNLVGNILLLSKVDNQAIGVQATTFRLDEQIRQAILQLESQWEKKDIWFDVEMGPVEYTGPENMLIHVWTNLIGNAIKFSPYGGKISIGLAKQDGKTVFTIADEGPGLSEEAQKHIFDKFYQADSSHKEEGNGLGLALVKKIVTISGGEVYGENGEKGGCRFTVVL